MVARSKRRPASRRRGKQDSKAFSWFAAGLILGLGISAYLYLQGHLPARPGGSETAGGTQASGEPDPFENESEMIPDEQDSQYDFFTVLPEMEVVVPEQELSGRARPDPALDNAATGERFILQAGSFRSAADADEMKARLALLGSVAAIQKVTVDQQTWHRVRIGPVEGARAADHLRRQLQNNGIEVLVLKDSS